MTAMLAERILVLTMHPCALMHLQKCMLVVLCTAAALCDLASGCMYPQLCSWVQIPPTQLSGATSHHSGVVSQPSEDLGGRERAPRRRFCRLDEDEKSTLLRKVTKVGQDLKLLIGGGHAADMDVGGRAHDNRVECMTAVMPYIFTASAANQACDAQIRMWVQSHEKESQQCVAHIVVHVHVHATYNARKMLLVSFMCMQFIHVQATRSNTRRASNMMLSWFPPCSVPLQGMTPARSGLQSHDTQLVSVLTLRAVVACAASAACMPHICDTMRCGATSSSRTLVVPSFGAWLCIWFVVDL
jgi:hypothetical protein